MRVYVRVCVYETGKIVLFPVASDKVNINIQDAADDDDDEALSTPEIPVTLRQYCPLPMKISDATWSGPVPIGKCLVVPTLTCACVNSTLRLRRCASGNCIGFESLTLHAPRPPMLGMCPIEPPAEPLIRRETVEKKMRKMYYDVSRAFQLSSTIVQSIIIRHRRRVVDAAAAAITLDEHACTQVYPYALEVFECDARARVSSRLKPDTRLCRRTEPICATQRHTRPNHSESDRKKRKPENPSRNLNRAHKLGECVYSNYLHTSNKRAACACGLPCNTDHATHGE